MIWKRLLAFLFRKKEPKWELYIPKIKRRTRQEINMDYLIKLMKEEENEKPT